MKDKFIKFLDSLCEILLVIALIVISMAISNLANRMNELEKIEHKIDTVYIKVPVTPEFFLSESPEDHLMDALEFFGVKHKDIVYAQAILETGHFNSNICKEYNNLFGLYNSYKKDYYRFKHWTESVEAYLKYIQYRYKPPNNYYRFLDSIGYAEDPEYTAKVKKIVNRIENGKI